MLSATNPDGPAFNTRSRPAQHGSSDNTIPKTDAVELNVTDAPSNTPKSLTADRLWEFFQMQKTDPFCKCILKQLSNEKAPKHETNLFLHVKGLLYKHITDSHQKFLALGILKAWKYTVLVEAHDKRGHQEAMWTYSLIKHQYFWKGMNKDIKIYCSIYTLPQRKRKKFKLTLYKWQKFQNAPLTRLLWIWSQNAKLPVWATNISSP